MKKLTIENNSENLSKIAEFIEGFCKEYGLENKTVFELNLVLDELFTNIVNYAYLDSDVHTIEIFTEAINDEIIIKIIDDGKEFNPLHMEDVNINASIDDRNIGGLGIHLVKRLTDKLSYERLDNKNILTIIKKILANGDKNENCDL